MTTTAGTITTEEGAANARAAMAALIPQIQQARADKDKPLWEHLKAQYTTLQAALQEYNAGAKAHEPQTGGQGLTNEERAEMAKLRQELQAIKSKYNASRYEADTLRDEVRTLRNAPTPEQQAKATALPSNNPTNDKGDKLYGPARRTHEQVIADVMQTIEALGDLRLDEGPNT